VRRQVDAHGVTTQIHIPAIGKGHPLEQISPLVGHGSTAVTELAYRKQIRPVLQAGAIAMDRISTD
jgi:hypothetical protein